MLAPRFPRGIDVVDLSALLLFAGALLIAAGSPGPSIAALVARVVTAGWRGVLPFIAAMWIGEAIWLSLAVWGLAAVAEDRKSTRLNSSLMRISYAVFCLKKKNLTSTDTNDYLQERI